MTKTTVDVVALYGALDAARQARGLSWRQAAKEIGVSPSLLSRLANGQRPDADGFLTLTGWLGMPPQDFVAGNRAARAPELSAQVVPLLRAQAELTPEDLRYLEEVIQATVRHARARAGRPG